MNNWPIDDWMTRDVLTVAPDTSLTQVDVMMEARNIRRLLVVEDGTLTGIISLSDVREAKAHQAAGGHANDPMATEFMTPDPIFLPAGATMGLAAKTMLQAKINCLPIVGFDGEVQGILTDSDVFRLLVSLAEAPTD